MPLEIAEGPFRATVEVFLAHHRTWRPLADFLLHTEHPMNAETTDAFIVRTNDMGWRP